MNAELFLQRLGFTELERQSVPSRLLGARRCKAGCNSPDPAEKGKTGAQTRLPQTAPSDTRTHSWGVPDKLGKTRIVAAVRQNMRIIKCSGLATPTSDHEIV